MIENINPSDFYNYYKECYKLDNKEFVVENVLAKKYLFKWFVSGDEELFHKSLPVIPYQNKQVNEIETELTVYKFEKELFYGCFFVLGKNENPLQKNDKRICAPLILFPASIETIGDEKFLKIEHDNYIINRSVLSRFNLADSSQTNDQFIEDISALLDNDRSNSVALQNIINKYFPFVNTEELVLFPKVWSQQKVKAHLAETTYRDDEYKIVPGATTFIANKSESSLKVIHDLDEMASKSSFNSSLKELISGTEKTGTNYSSYFKSRLNSAQFQALKNAQIYSNSVIVGPPGTGKTYTITSIISEAVLNNQSVLVVSKTKQAVEVLRNMLNDDFGLKNYLIHTTGHSYKVSLKAKIRKYLSGITRTPYASSNEEKLTFLYKKLDELEFRFEKFVERELKISSLSVDPDLNLFQKWKKFYWTSISANSNEMWEIFNRITETILELELVVSTFSRLKIANNIFDNVHNFRQDLSLFFDALESTSFTDYKRILKDVDHQNILKVFPIWLANLTELNSVLPLQKDLFDLVIIDESTQCDIASALPAIYRAKRAVIVGDPNQLRHYSFVSKNQQNGLLKEYNLPLDNMFNFREKSILDIYISKLKNQYQITFLREHFRSTPSLIEFSNEHFYESQLEILKSTPEFTSLSQIETIQTDGKRDQNGVNEIEAIALINKLDEELKKYKNTDRPPSFGIISPFSSQVNFLNKILKDKYDLDTFKKFNLLCGTPYHFQGSEREIVFLSFCVCDETHPSAFIHVNNPEVLNVAITRAKSFQFIFKSISKTSLKEESLLHQYFNFVENFNHDDTIEHHKDLFQLEVKDELNKLGFTNIICGYPVAGCVLDILVVHNERNYFIDLIGYPGLFNDAFTIERYQTLARIGIQSLPMHYSFWQKNKKLAVDKMNDFLR